MLCWSYIACDHFLAGVFLSKGTRSGVDLLDARCLVSPLCPNCNSGWTRGIRWETQSCTPVVLRWSHGGEDDEWRM